LASKTISGLPKLSANHTAFDLPVHEGRKVAPPRERSRTREHNGERGTPVQPIPQTGTPPQDHVSNGTPQTPNRTVDAVLRTLNLAVADANGSMQREPPPVGGAPKRALDVAIAGTAVLVLSPLIVMVALLVVLTMGRPILFPQRRLGYGGKTFACYKFRTMVTNADDALKAYLAANPEAAREWRVRQKLQHDPRVTLLGRMLRRSSLDELPQLLNVLRGDMSCIGPRPVVHDEIARYGKYWKDYTRARPGLTGAWQVSGRNRLSYPRRVAIDSRYVRKWSLAWDLWILVKTIPAVLRSDTA
jgi:exopolysaccharide production protein ExoY